MHRQQRRAIQAIQLQTCRSGTLFHQATHLFGQAPSSSDGIHTSDPIIKSDEKSQKEGLMTRKLLLTAAIVALPLAPSIGTGTAQAREPGVDT
jgi:hypothetical protein